MCGIAGVWGPFNIGCIKAMVIAMHHRGPDDSGIWIDEKIGLALGNTRLAIQDLSLAGHMPMTDGACWITYNGEIYNFIEMREELETLGHVFHTYTDTEVILAAYRQWGTDCLQHFRGMFAFAIYDPDNAGQLFLGRDHFGIKPLYWTIVNDTFVFASELKALLASGIVSKNIDKQAIWDYFSVGSVIPPRTIFSQVQMLLPGHAMIIKDRKKTIWRWWDLVDNSQHIEVPKTITEAALEVRRLLNESIHLQMIADVSIGAFLSGGIDSSTIVALASQQSSRPLQTYSIAFQTSKNTTSELPYARLVSNQYNTLHEEIVIREEDILQHFDEIVLALDQPSIDGFNSYVVSSAAKRSVTAALSGLGSDELFAGYPQFGRFVSASEMCPNGSSLLAKLIGNTGSVLPSRLRLPLEFLASSLVDRHCITRRLLTSKQKLALFNPRWSNTVNLCSQQEFYSALIRPQLDPVMQTSYIETKGYMGYTLLRDVDVMSMAHSLEVRVPFLDHKLAEFVFAMPGEWKWQKDQNKILLRKAVNDLLPDDVLKRTKKGFDLPVTDWIQGKLKHVFQETLQSSLAANVLSSTAQNSFAPSTNNGKSFVHWSILIMLRWLLLNDVSLDEFV